MVIKVRTLLVDDNRPFLILARHLLASFTEIEIVGEAYDGEEAVRIANDLGALVTDAWWEYLED